MPKRSSWMPRRNKERHARTHALAFGPQSRLCRELVCCACGARPPSEAAHVNSRGSGGKDDECVPLCPACHDEQGLGAETFQQVRQVDLELQRATMRNRVRFHECSAYPEATKGGGTRCRVCLEPVDPTGLCS